MHWIVFLMQYEMTWIIPLDTLLSWDKVQGMRDSASPTATVSGLPTPQSGRDTMDQWLWGQWQVGRDVLPSWWLRSVMSATGGRDHWEGLSVRLRWQPGWPRACCWCLCLRRHGQHGSLPNQKTNGSSCTHFSPMTEVHIPTLIPYLGKRV